MLLTSEQEMLREMLRRYSREQLAPNADRWERERSFPWPAIRDLAELGVLGMTVPEEWGGAGLDYMSLVLAVEEIAASATQLAETAAQLRGMMARFKL